MPLELERSVVSLVRVVLGGEVLATPGWLQRPGREDCGRRWPVVCRIYTQLTRMELPDEMPARERPTVDLVLKRGGDPPRIVEVDETQHFNAYRALTIRAYPRSAEVSFDRRTWLQACARKRRLEGGGFGRPKPPLFPEDGGRHKQRAFRDALCDLVPVVHGWLPTLRIADFEVASWLRSGDARVRMEVLL
ncbi:MAG: hypothetical protein ACRDSN_11695, partial [Pseudonocardiaceae bacterium]